MHVVTFYSYKGGVGRTMALVNTALILARRGRRVLIVDFDLEAPGIPTYDAFAGAAEHIGLVDYISEYLRLNASPDASAYIAACEFEGRPLWVMPAGSNVDQGYSRRLNQIDWQNLYDNRDGFLMFEDLRTQWARFGGHGFDYVLIDSRTGYTDVGGICTRQLPDAVVAMFLPNAQNIRGLAGVVKEIRDEMATVRTIQIHFCPANVPNLDDERDILRDNLAEAKAGLDYKDNAAVIHHYASLDILKQTPFVVSRPNSLLSKEYGELERAIIAGSHEDRDGAIITLQKVLARHALAKPEERSEIIVDVLPTVYSISSYHHRDPEVAYYLSRVFAFMGFVDDELDALSVSIEGGYLDAESRIRRARALQSSGRPQEAIDDLVVVIQSRGTEPFNLVPALTNLRAADPEHWLDVAAEMPSLEYADSQTIYRVATILRVNEQGHELSRGILEGALQRPDLAGEDRLRRELVLNLIGLKRFDDALALLGSDDEILASHEISKAFNGALAMWGRDGRADPEAFGRVLELDIAGRSIDDANYYQCVALAAFVVGDHPIAYQAVANAKSALGGAARIFSCWTYTDVSRARMADHLKTMQDQAEAGELQPPAVSGRSNRALN